MIWSRSTAFQAEMVVIAYMPDTSCPVTLVSLGIAFQASGLYFRMLQERMQISRKTVITNALNVILCSIWILNE